MKFTILKNSFIILLIIFFSSCSDSRLKIQGNIEKVLYLSKHENFNDFLTDQGFEVKLILFESLDNKGVIVRSESLPFLWLNYSSGWEIETELLPDPVKLKNVIKATVLTENEQSDVYHLRGTEQILKTNQFFQRYKSFSYTDTAIKNGHYIKLYDYNEDYCFPLESDSLLIIFSNNQRKFYSSAYVEKNLDLFNNLMMLDGKQIAVLWEESPERQINEIFTLMKNDLRNNRVLALFIDGLGYKLWQHFCLLDNDSYLSKIEFQPLAVAYPPRTRYSYYSIATGDFIDTFESDFSEKKFFQNLLDVHQKGVVLEDWSSMYRFAIDVIYHRQDSENLADHFIFETTKAKISEDYDFILAHFHSIDDFGHKYGPYSEENLNQLEVVSGYIEEIISLFSGVVYIFSDHGMHFNSNFTDMYRTPGVHFSGRAEDIIGIFRRLETNIGEGV